MKHSKEPKPLTREQYLKKFSRAVRWRLPPQEAAEAISDYRELIFQEERDESRLVEELGEPVQAAHLLTDVKSYRRWLWVFGILAFGLFLLAKWNWMGFTPFYINWAERWWYPVWVMVVGLPLSLYWFYRHGQKNGPLSRRLVSMLAVVMVVGCGVLLFIWYAMGMAMYRVYESSWVEDMFTETIEITELGAAVASIIMYVGILAVLAGLAGLILAKSYDRRWLALYTLCLTLAAMLCFVQFFMGRMDLSIDTPEIGQAYVFARILPVGAVGLIGTGVALC